MNIIFLQKKLHESPYKNVIENSLNATVKYDTFEQLCIKKTIDDIGLFVLDFAYNVDVARDTELVSSLRVMTNAPIVLLSEEGTSAIYREEMLDAGVDSCAQRPFLDEELLLRLSKVSQKKNGLLFKGTTIRHGGIAVNLRHHTIVCGDEEVNLTRTETALLEHLLLKKDRPVQYEELGICLTEKKTSGFGPVRVHISRLRSKLGNTKMIQTIPHYGFVVRDFC